MIGAERLELVGVLLFEVQLDRRLGQIERVAREPRDFAAPARIEIRR